MEFKPHFFVPVSQDKCLAIHNIIILYFLKSKDKIREKS